MARRTNELYETYKSLRENKAAQANKEIEKINEAVKAKESFSENYYNIKNNRRKAEGNRARLLEGARDDALKTVLKAIYITALEANTLTDNGIILAEAMVDKYVTENGGASKILGKSGNNTYLLARITQIVEDAAREEVKDIEKDDDKVEEEEKAEKENRIKDIAITAAEEFIKKASKKETEDFIDQLKGISQDETDNRREKRKEYYENHKEDEKDNSSKSDETKEKESDNSDNVEDDGSELKVPQDQQDNDKEGNSSDENNTEKSDDSLNMTFDNDSSDNTNDSNNKSENDEKDTESSNDNDEEKDSDNDGVSNKIEEDNEKETDEELGDRLDDDEINNDITVDGDTENGGKIFDDLSKEDDIQKAINIIRTRVADAEESFIKNNAEDKKKIDELLNKISNNVKTVEDINNDEDTKSKIAQESARLYRRQIDVVREGRPLTVFERMARNITTNIVKDSVLRESYTDEDTGTLDTYLVVESAKVIYGFLETLNTIQLEKVNESYIKKVLDDMVE